MKHVIYILLLLCLFYSCSSDGREDLLPELVRAETLMSARPDSALSILESMAAPGTSDRFQNAVYALLLVQARDKNYITHTSDSLIDVAYRYFIKRDDPHRKALTLNYEGRVNEDLGEEEKAAGYYLQARDMADKTDDYELRFLIASNLGRIYLYRDLHQEAKQFYREANEYARKKNAPGAISASYSYLGRAFIAAGQSDSAIVFYKEALAIARLSDDSDNLKRVLNELAAVYRETARYDSAIVYLRKDEILEKRSKSGGIYQTYYGLGSVYLRSGNLDSAAYYLNKSLPSANIYVKRAVYKDFSELYEKQRQFENAVAYNKLFLHLHDSIREIEQTASISEIHNKYDHEKLKNEINLLKIKKGRTMWISLSVLLIFLAMLIFIKYLAHRKLQKKERLIKQYREKQEHYLMQLRTNEEKIKENEEQLQTLSEQLQENSGMIEEQTAEIETIHKQNEKLREANIKLQENINKYACSLKDTVNLPMAYLALSEKYGQLCLRERFLMDEVLRHIPVLKQIQENPLFLNEEQWGEIEQEVNLLYYNFMVRLQEQFPSLTKEDIRLCCLIKLGLPNVTISKLLCISPSSVTKRKQRMKDAMNPYLDKDLAKNSSFDLWIREY